MKTGLKYIAGFISILMILVASVALILTTLVNSDWLKVQIGSYVKSTTGRDLTIRGTLHASFWPRLGINAENISLSNAEGFGNEPFLSAQKLTISAELMPLLHHQLTVNHATLSNAVINLQKNYQGKTNWTFNSSKQLASTKATQSEKLDTADETAPDQATPAQNTPSENENQETMHFDIAGLALTRTTINYFDSQSNQHLSLENVNVTANKLQYDRPFPINGSFKYISNTKTSTEIKFETEAAYDAVATKITLDNLNLRIKPSDFSIVTLKGKAEANLNSASVNISPLALNLGDLKLKGDLTGRNLLDNPMLTGHVSSNTFNLTKLLASLGTTINLKNKSSLTQVQLTSDLQVSTQKISLHNITGDVDGQTITGRLDYLLTPTHHLNVALLSEELKIEDYLPGSGSEKSERSKKSALSGNAPLIIDGSIAVHRVEYSNYRLSGVKTSLRYSAKQLDLQNFSANIFNGRTGGSININFAGNAPAFAISQKMSGVRVEELLRTLTGSSKLTGVAALSVNIRTAGSSSGAIKRTLSGNVSFKVSNGIITGTDIDYKVDQAFAKFAQRTSNSADRGHTPFTHLSGSINLGNGISTIPNLELLTRMVRVDASGHHNLISDSIDYKLTCRLLQSQPIKTNYLGVQIDTDLSQYDIPARVGCTLQSPCVTVDMVGVMKILAKEGAKAAAKTVIKQHLLKNVDENLGNVLDSVFSQ